MKFETKYNLKQRVWVIIKKRVDVRHTCPTCGGGKKFTTTSSGTRSGAVAPEVKTIRCPECYGKGYITEWGERWVPEKGIIDDIHLSTIRGSLYVQYGCYPAPVEAGGWPDWRYTNFDEKNVYATKSQAMKAIKEKSK